MFEKESRLSFNNSLSVLAVMLVIGFVFAVVGPYIAILRLNSEPLTMVIPVGFTFQLAGLFVAFVLIRPVVEVIAHKLGIMRKIISRTPNLKQGVREAVLHYKSSIEGPVVVNTELGEVAEDDTQRLYIEFVSDRRFGVLFAELEDVYEDDIEELSFIAKDNDYTKYDCKVCMDKTQTLYSAPLYDSVEETSAGFYRMCGDCADAIMRDTTEELKEKSSEVVLKTI